MNVQADAGAGHGNFEHLHGLGRKRVCAITYDLPEVAEDQVENVATYTA